MSKYAIIKIDEIPDMSGDYPGEVKMLKKPLETEQVAVSYRKLPADTGSIRGSRRGHRHKTQEEIILVLNGTLDVKLDDEIIKVGPMTAVRIAPGVPQDVWNHGPAEVEMLIISTKAENLMDDLEFIDNFWD